ncbi:PH and SEC7 domain-containing protein [Vanrija pseudolonga]|uniref:PH and SEC7 domain-containing protein n=1 Tax=Vanrija pseudolonga TaxID=143232 RepID=A0AAF0Y1F9_9TREE|nr:PH and SEC7 domain-containing protein [Vanrija pseudolonga]
MSRTSSIPVPPQPQQQQSTSTTITPSPTSPPRPLPALPLPPSPAPVPKHSPSPSTSPLPGQQPQQQQQPRKRPDLESALLNPNEVVYLTAGGTETLASGQDLTRTESYPDHDHYHDADIDPADVDDNMLARAHTGASDILLGNDDHRGHRSRQASEGSTSPNVVRRGSLVSNDSGRGSNSTPQQRVQQRKMMYAQQASLGLDAEIKAEEQNQPPKRRSIFRNTGTASTPDLTTLIRGSKAFKRNGKQGNGDQPAMPVSHHAMGKGPGNSTAASSSTAIGSHIGSHLTSSTSSLTGRSRNQPNPPTRNTDWERLSASYSNDHQRGMPSIAETPSTEAVGRHASSDDGYKKRKPKGMFGRMFGSSNSQKEQHGPLTSSSQISLSARSNHDVGSPTQSQSPQFAGSNFPGNNNYNFEMHQHASASSGHLPLNGAVQPQPSSARPPIPQRPSVPIVSKVEKRASVDTLDHPPLPEPKRSGTASSAGLPDHDPKTGEVTEVVLDRVESPVPINHTRHTSITSVGSANVEQPPMAHVLPRENVDGAQHRPPVPRRVTGEDASKSPKGGRNAPSFTDDVSGLLDRISHGDASGRGGVRVGAATGAVAGIVAGAAVVAGHDTPNSDHLQVSPEIPNSTHYSPALTASPGRSQSFTERSPSMSRQPGSRSGTHDEGLVPEPLPVPSGDIRTSGAPNADAPITAEQQSTPVVTTSDGAEGDAPPQDTPRQPSQRSDTGEWPLRHDSLSKSPSSQQQWDRQLSRPTSSGSGPLVDEPITIEVSGSPSESMVNLNDLGDAEERGAQLAREFFDDDPSTVPADKVAMFIGGPRPVNNFALRYYMQYFDMRGLKLDQAFRDLCGKLHLKAESQEIDRIIEGFSGRFFECNPNTVLGTPGIVHTVTAAMLMLNTDLHIAELAKHMSRTDFVRNAMRAIQESMPDREMSPEPGLASDSGSLRHLDSHSAAQSTSSIRLRAASSNLGSTPRNASGSLASPVSEISLTSPSTQDLRSRGASSTTVNSFTYTKAWEIEAENFLRDIYTNVRNERILLPIASLPGNEGKNGGGLSSLSLRPPGQRGQQQFQPLAPALGFAGNLSHTVIKEQEDETRSVQSVQTTSTLEEMTDVELALLGAPWAKEGLLHRKIQVEAHGKRAPKKDWKQYFVVIQKGDLHMFIFGQGSGSFGGGSVGGGNWMSNAKATGEYSLMHAMAMALPKPGYSAQRPYCFTVTLPSGEISVFQAGTEELVAEWVATCNYWAARKSRQPLPGGVSNMEYGWSRALGHEDFEDKASVRSARSGLSRLGGLNARVRGAAAVPTHGPDKIHINEWKPPPHATMPSTLDEEAQLDALLAYVQKLKEELEQHKAIEEPMARLYTAGSKNALKARENWTAKSRYIHSEIFKYETYVEALRNAIGLRVQKQGEKKLERSLQRSTLSLQQQQEAARRRPVNGSRTSSEQGSGQSYTTGEDGGHVTPTK